MLSKLLVNDPLRCLRYLLLVSVVFFPTVSQADGFSTLFTTTQERQLIDSNRYTSEAALPAPVVEVVEVEETIEEAIPMIDISTEYRISGITLSKDGAHSVWVNGMVYESGDELDDGSTIEVLSGREIKARITTAAGAQYSGLAGDTIEVTFRVPADSQ